MRRRSLVLVAFVLPAAACRPTASPAPRPGPDRIVAIERDGTILRQSTADEHSRTPYNAPISRVWRAVMVSYAELGIEPTIADRAVWRYGNEGFIVPRRFADRPIGSIFHCGSGITGPLVDRGRLIADVMTSLTPTSDTTTIMVTHIRGALHSNEGTSTEPLHCSSTGVIEELLQAAIARNLTTVK